MSAGALPPLTGAAFGGKPDDFQVHTVKPDVRFLIKGVQPPSNVYVTVDDDLIIGCASSQTNEAVTVSYRLLRPDGQIILGQCVVRPASDRSVTVHSESLCEGFLLSVSCKAAIATTRGQTFARIFLSNPSLGGGQPSYMLMADYVTTAMAPAFPNGRQLAPVEGPGWINAVGITIAFPTGQWSANVPTNARWRIISAQAFFVTDATVGNRSLEVQIFSGAARVWESGASAVVPPSSTYYHTVAPIDFPQYPSVTPGVNSPIPPDMIVLAGGQVIADATPLGAFDSYFLPKIYVEEWLDNV